VREEKMRQKQSSQKLKKVFAVMYIFLKNRPSPPHLENNFFLRVLLDLGEINKVVDIK